MLTKRRPNEGSEKVVECVQRIEDNDKGQLEEPGGRVPEDHVQTDCRLFSRSSRILVLVAREVVVEVMRVMVLVIRVRPLILIVFKGIRCIDIVVVVS